MKFFLLLLECLCSVYYCFVLLKLVLDHMEEKAFDPDLENLVFDYSLVLVVCYYCFA